MPLTYRRARCAALCLIVLLPVLVHVAGLLNILSPDPLHIFMRFGEDNTSLLDGSPGWVDANAGATTEALGTRAARQWLSGHIPWWDSYSGMGMPLAAEMQNSALFLPFILLLIFKNGLLYLKISVQIATGLAMFGLAREMRLTLLAATLAAVLDEFSGTLAWFAHGPIMPLPFLPLFVWGVMRCCATAEKNSPEDQALTSQMPSGQALTGQLLTGRLLTGWALTGLAVAGSIVAGFPETAYMNGLLVLLIAIWRVSTTGRAWKTAALHIIGGGLLGLALSAPAWIPFAEALPLSYVGQNQNFHDAHMLRPNAALLFFPYLLGPPLYAIFGTSPKLIDIWWHTGGYCDIALLFAALIAVMRTRAAARSHDRTLWPGLRYVLLGYCVITGLKALGVVPVSRALDLIPGIRQTMFYVYISPGWWFALSLLAALAVQDLRKLGPVPRPILLAALAVVTTFSGIALFQAREIVRMLLPHPGYVWYPCLSVAWTLILCVTLAATLRRARPGLATGLLLTNAAVLFFIPTLCGVRPGSPDLPAIAALKSLTTEHRVLSLNGLTPNYGAFYGIPAINYNYLPLPARFADALDHNVCPGYEHTTFDPWKIGRFCTGSPDNTSGDDWKNPNRMLSVRSAFAWLEAHNVGYVIHAQGMTIRRDHIATPITGDDRTGQPLTDNPVEGHLISARLRGTTIRRVGVLLSTYLNAARGTLHIALCSRTLCTQTDSPLANAADNRLTWLTLPTPLSLAPDETDLIWRVSATEVTRPALLWLWHIHDATTGAPQSLPLITVEFDLPEDGIQRVYEDKHFVIEKLPDATSYFTAPGCTLHPASRTELTADCPNPSILTRNELSFPDWTATVNGTRHLAGTAPDGLQQTIPLPQGHASVVFSYAPRHIGLIETLFATGLLILIVGTARQNRNVFRKRRARTGN
ncbi:hypothetical protein [Acetobacter oeni]|uniref:YfhO family protein n=1 Tax=Acetobacter oeni TaxID=304077 RepID=A0A511XNF3_9PROT|nr:hypothetical protein [Acetobacter oeni]MBB3884349.1 hypothetical protein [Acetobacter oeni]NHO20299.1 hypothetical protein [Acetobacter oeni]GBR05281.1 hypothetical protein AA21952_1682 [Acetobacter oeni LMG 21952]GEN64473.1 hypothetical protein AOE01nite_26970 [Acetobacter oeni]